MIILLPIDRVIGYVFPDTVQFLFIANDMIPSTTLRTGMKTGLPGEIDIVQGGIFFDPGFESADNGGQILGLGSERVGRWWLRGRL